MLVLEDEGGGEAKRLLPSFRPPEYQANLAVGLHAASALIDEDRPDALLVELAVSPRLAGEYGAFLQRCQQTLHLALLLLVPQEVASTFDASISCDDYVLAPYRPAEVLLRLRRLLQSSQAKQGSGRNVIAKGDLTLDLDKYEVTLAGKKLDLTYKEYELLRVLASTPGRVFTREALLNKVWSYDYLGGTRTVDVHVRRLRSKIEDATHLFIDTVRNVGYRFRDPDEAA